MVNFGRFFGIVKSELPGQKVTGRVCEHSAFPGHRVRRNKVKEATTVLKAYRKAIQFQNSKEATNEYQGFKALGVGLLLMSTQLVLTIPWSYVFGHPDPAIDGNFVMAHLGPYLWGGGVMAGVFAGLLSWTSHELRVRKYEDAEAMWTQDRDIRNEILVHALTHDNSLTPMYSAKDVVRLNTPVKSTDGTKQTVLDIAPDWVPRTYKHEMPSDFRVWAQDGKSILSAGDKGWPSIQVPASFMKFDWEGPFSLMLGEAYEKDGRWNLNPKIRSINPAGLFTSMLVLGGTGTGKSQSGLLPFIYQILAWNATIDSEADVIDYLRARGLRGDGDEDEISKMDNDEILKLSEAAWAKMMDKGSVYEIAKMFMFLVEPKGELAIDVKAFLKQLGRPNDMVELGTDAIQIDRWREIRQRLRTSAVGLYSLWDFDTISRDLSSGLAEHMAPSWQSEIVRRMSSGDWASLGYGFTAKDPNRFRPLPISLRDFEPGSRVDVPADSAVTIPGGDEAVGPDALSQLLGGFSKLTREVSDQLYSPRSFGGSNVPNLFLGFTFEAKEHLKEHVALADFQGATQVRDTLLDTLGLIGAATGVLDGKNGLDGLFRGLSVERKSGVFFPGIRGVALSPAPSAPEGNKDKAPDVVALIVGELSSKAPVEDDEERLLKVIRLMAPQVRRPAEDYSEWIFRRRAAALLAEKRHHDFQIQLNRVRAGIGRLVEAGFNLQDVLERLYQVFGGEVSTDLEMVVGDLEFEGKKHTQTGFQSALREAGYSPISTRALGEYDTGIRVGLAPIDSGWNRGAWHVLNDVVATVVGRVIEESTRRIVLHGRESHESAKALRLESGRFLEAVDAWVQASQGYYSVMTPATMGFAVRRVVNPGLLSALVEKVVSERASDPVAARKAQTAHAAYLSRGWVTTELVDTVAGEWSVAACSCFGANQYNPLYQPGTSPTSIGTELGAAMTAGDASGGESFWSDAYTQMSGMFIAISYAATGYMTFRDLLGCFMHASYRSRMLQLAEARLAAMKQMARRLDSDVVLTSQDYWGSDSLSEAQVAEREWALFQMQDMTGMAIEGGAWLGGVMDGGPRSGSWIRPSSDKVTADDVRTVLPSFSGDSLDVLSETSLSSLLGDLRKAGVELPAVGSPLVRKLAGAFIRTEVEGAVKPVEKGKNKGKIRVTKSIMHDYISGRRVLALASNWEFVSWADCVASGQVALRVDAVPALTPPPITMEAIQALEQLVSGYKEFETVTLRGDALRDEKVRGNILISILVKIDPVRGDGATYSFMPRSKHSITFPTFTEVRTRGLVVCSRITDSVYADIGTLVTRLARQQFERTIRSRAGNQKALLYGTADAPPRMEVANNRAAKEVTTWLGQIAPMSEVVAAADSVSIPEDPKGRLDAYVALTHQREALFQGVVGDLRGLNGAPPRFLRRLAAQDPAMNTGNGLSDAACERLVLEALACAGCFHAARLGAPVEALRSRLETTEQPTPRHYEDDDVIRGMAMLAVFPDVVHAIAMEYGKFNGPQAVEKLKRLHSYSLGTYHSDLGFGRVMADAIEAKSIGQAGVVGVATRRDLLVNLGTIMDEPNYRRLGAYITDEVQKYVIGSGKGTDGDGGYLEVARAGMCFNIVATQMVASFKKALGDDQKRYLGNILTWLVLMIPDTEDAKTVAELFGAEYQGTTFKVEGSIQGVDATANGIRGSQDDLSIRLEDNKEQKGFIHANDLLNQEAMQAYLRVRDGQRTDRMKLYTTPAFILAGDIKPAVNPYGSKHLLLRAQEKLRKKPDWVMSYKEAMEIVQDHGAPWVEEPVVRLIQHRIMDMSKTVTAEEAQSDARIHAARVYQGLKRGH